MIEKAVVCTWEKHALLSEIEMRIVFAILYAYPKKGNKYISLDSGCIIYNLIVIL